MWTKQVTYDINNATYWESQLYQPDTTKSPLAPNLVHGSIFTVAWTRTEPTGVVEDRAMTSWHFIQKPGPGPEGLQLSAADAATVEASFATSVWTGRMNGYTSSQWKIAEYQWRNFGADFPLGETGLSKPGPVWRVIAVDSNGLETNVRLSDSSAVTATYRTASRRHWGRNYWGGLTANAYGASTFGRLQTTYCDAYALGLRTWFNDLYDNARIIEPVVWSSKYRGWLTVNELAVDDVPDVIRRRRAKRATYKRVYTS